MFRRAQLLHNIPRLFLLPNDLPLGALGQASSRLCSQRAQPRREAKEGPLVDLSKAKVCPRVRRELAAGVAGPQEAVQLALLGLRLVPGAAVRRLLQAEPLPLDSEPVAA